jgi:hypothetical protein
MSLERPDAADLLATARRIILEEIAPALADEARFKALMAANAIGIALRHTPESTAAAAQAWNALGDARTLVARIRAGELDPGTPDHEPTRHALLRLAQARCAVSAPKAVQA